MTTEDLRRAAEMVVADPAFCRCGKPGCRRAAAVRVARAWLAEHPADDGEPVSGEWLRSIGFTGPDGLLGIIYGEVELTTTTSSRWLVGNPSEIHGESVYIPAPTTRGDVRRLCAALGVPAGGEVTV